MHWSRDFNFGEMSAFFYFDLASFFSFGLATQVYKDGFTVSVQVGPLQVVVDY